MSDELAIDLVELQETLNKVEEDVVAATIVRIENSMRKIDLTKIAAYTNKINDIGKGFNTMLAPIYMRDFIMAYDLANLAYSRIIQCDIEVDTLVNMAEAIAYLDNAAKHLKDRNIKDTAEARKRYVFVDQGVVAATNLKAKTSALASFLKNKLIEFRCAHDDVKKIAYDKSDTGNEGI